MSITPKHIGIVFCSLPMKLHHNKQNKLKGGGYLAPPKFYYGFDY